MSTAFETWSATLSPITVSANHQAGADARPHDPSECRGERLRAATNRRRCKRDHRHEQPQRSTEVRHRRELRLVPRGLKLRRGRGLHLLGDETRDLRRRADHPSASASITPLPAAPAASPTSPPKPPGASPARFTAPVRSQPCRSPAVPRPHTTTRRGSATARLCLGRVSRSADLRTHRRRQGVAHAKPRRSRPSASASHNSEPVSAGRHPQPPVP